MRARPATPDDAAEVVRLAAMMFDSMGMDTAGTAWQEAARRQMEGRLGGDMAAFVVTDPDSPGRLVASAAGTLNRRLPSPVNPSGTVGYVQWVCTEPGFRGRGLARAVMSSLLDWFDGQASVRWSCTPPPWRSLSISASASTAPEAGRSAGVRSRADRQP